MNREIICSCPKNKTFVTLCYTGGMLVLQAQPADFWEYSIWRGSEIKGNVKCAAEAVWNG